MAPAHAPGPLERKLFLTIVAGLFPLAALALFALLPTAQSQRKELLEGAQGTMRAVVSAVDSELSAAIASLDALAASPRLALDDFAALHAEALELLRRRPSWGNVVLSDADGQQLLNARRPFGSLLTSTNYEAGVLETVKSGRPTIGDVIYSDTLASYAFPVHVPIHGDHGVRYVLSAVLRTDTIQAILRGQNPPAAGVVAIFDTNFNVVARTLSYEETVGRPGSQSLVTLLEQGQRSGWAMTSTIENVPVYTVIYRSPSSGWTAAIGLPASLLNSPVTRSYFVFGGLILGSLLMGVGVAMFVSRTITNPMRELKLAAEMMGRGTAPATPDTDLPEIRNVAAALAAAHAEREALLAAERESRENERQARLTAERANRLKDEFLAMLGHELRNPLAAISSASMVLEAAATKPGSEAAVESSARIIHRQTRHLARLTDDLLDAGRVVLGRIKLDRRPIELAAIVQSCVDTLRNTNLLADRAVSVAASPVWVNGDPTRMDQIVANILTNAVKFTPSQGRIDVHVGRSGDQAVLRVRDSGVGIEAELLPRIFELFVQGERAPDRTLGGLGIGLTMVRRLAELHDGSVEVASDGPGQGTEFTVKLPAIDAPADAVARPDVAPFEPCSLAIVEDNDDVRGSLRALLELAGHRVCMAADGESGLSLIEKERPDVALIDIGLPVLDGYAVARAIRQKPELGSTFLVAMTGYGAPGHVEAGKQAGFDAYVVKPADQEKLTEVIAQARRRGDAAERTEGPSADRG